MRSSLKRHILSVHEKVKAYKCDLCDATFTPKARLKTHHSSVHEEKKPYECPICQARYAHRTAMVNHISSVHEQITHNCKICNVSFKVKQSLNEHIKKNH